MIAVVIAAPLVASLLALPIRALDLRRYARLGLALIAAVLPLSLIGKVDPLSLLFVGIISTLSFLATVFSTGIFSIDWGVGEAVWSRKSVYFILLGGFWSAMLFAVLATNYSFLWLGISMTTLATAFLVGFSGEPEALEAAWKYLVLCSVGIAFALLGILALASVAGTLSWTDIGAHPATPLARIAIVLMTIGFATKAGLVPMHSWLPDAHSKAPAPVSALLSGVLISCSLYAIMRVAGTAAAFGNAGLFQEILLVFGAASTIVAGILMLVQYDLKRLLAYSTVEHAGLVALALGFGGSLGLFAALFHVLNHALAKAAAFFSAGIVQRSRATTSLAELHGLWSTRSGRLLLAAVTALCGLPPFGLFVSELLILAAGIAAHQWFALSIGIVGIMLAFVALTRATIEIEGGRSPQHSGRVFPALSFDAAVVVLGLALVAAIVPWTGAGDTLRAIASGIGRF